MATGSIMGYQKDPFEFTATGILGSKRDTMLNNEILLRVSIQFTKNIMYFTVNLDFIIYTMMYTNY